MKNKTEYQITIGYKAVVCFMVKAENEEQAKKVILETIREKGIYKGDVQDENYAVHGLINMDETWNMVQS